MPGGAGNGAQHDIYMHVHYARRNTVYLGLAAALSARQHVRTPSLPRRGGRLLICYKTRLTLNKGGALAK